MYASGLEEVEAEVVVRSSFGEHYIVELGRLDAWPAGAVANRECIHRFGLFQVVVEPIDTEWWVLILF